MHNLKLISGLSIAGKVLKRMDIAGSYILNAAQSWRL